MRLFWRNAGLLNVWFERFMKKQNLQLSPGCEQRWGKPGRHVEGDGDILMSTSSLQNARLGRWKQVRGLREDRVPCRRGAV